MGLLKEIGTFGDVAAEDDDAVLSYFLKTSAVDQIESGASYAVIGRKGSGKTALAKYFSQPRKSYVSTSPTLRDYPWSIHSKRRNSGASDIESYVGSWRYLIAVKATSTILEQRGMKAMTDAQRAAREFLLNNYGGVSPSLGDIIRAKSLKVSKRILSPSVMGNSLGSIELEAADGSMSQETDVLTEALLKNVVTLCSQSGLSNVLVHFDELDQGLGRLDDQRKKMIIGLVLAIRSIRSSVAGKVLFPAAYVRTDIWDELKFSDKNKVSQSSAVFLEWDSETLLEMVTERIKAKAGAHRSWTDLDDEKLMRGSQSKWSHIIARTFLRPRDVIQFLNYALEIAVKLIPGSDFFDNDDIQRAREPYSKYLKQELDDEISPHWDNWTEALQAFSEISTMTFSRESFNEVYERRRSIKNIVNADEALELLYSFSVIGYRKGIGTGGSGWVFQYTDPDAGWDSATSRLKVHPGLKEIAKLREERA